MPAENEVDPSTEMHQAAEDSGTIVARQYAEQDDEYLQKDTMDAGFTTEELMDPPGDDASQEERMDFFHQQLDDLGKSHVAFEGIVFLGSGDIDHVQGGRGLLLAVHPTYHKVPALGH